MNYIIRNDKFDSTITKHLPGIKNRRAFVEEFMACAYDPARDLTQVLNHLSENLTNWRRMLVDPLSEKNIEYCSLLAYITEEDPLVVIREWTLAHEEEIIPHVFEAYIRVIRKNPFPDFYRYSYNWFAIVSKYFRIHLANIINRWFHRKRPKLFRIEYLPSMDWIENVSDSAYSLEEHMDLYRQIERLPPYEYYLVSLYLCDHNRYDYLELTRTTSSFVYFWRAVNDFRKTENTRNRTNQQSELTSTKTPE